ncbi:MAG: DegT/DnrJ/EryC1/StrS family aminotransferase [bacterium]
MVPKLDELEESYRQAMDSRMVTTGPNAELLGTTAAELLGVDHAIAVSSCTAGLLLATQALNLPPGSEVIMPSFTFMATALGAVWNGLRPRFVDVDWRTMNIDPDRVEEAISSKTSAIFAVHQFGNPAPVERLKKIADRHGLKLLYDGAHGLGSKYRGTPVGRFGEAEVFSMSPTKLVIAAEGGLVTTNDARIAEHVRLGRNYGNPGNYDCLFPGLNARMSELHALMALRSFEKLDHAVDQRNQAVHIYSELLADIPGILIQQIHPADVCSYKDITITIEEHDFGITRDRFVQALKADGIETRVYYAPVLHKMTAFQQYHLEDDRFDLRNTLYLEKSAVSLPLYSDMTPDEVEQVCHVIRSIFYYREDIKNLTAA